MEIVVATRNPHKLGEIRQILRGIPVRLVPADEAGAPDVVEDRPTLEENARKKAGEVAAATGRWAIADDTGLIVDALGGRPGVLSARYAGPGATYAQNVARLLEEMRDVPPERRTARFECVIALCSPPERDEVAGAFSIVRTFVGILPGAIALEPRGGHGFGYDPVFLVARDAKGRTLAELAPEEKNRISHRAQALDELRASLPELIATAS